MMTLLTPELKVMLQFIDDDEKVLVSATFDRGGALDISSKIQQLAELIPETEENKSKTKGH